MNEIRPKTFEERDWKANPTLQAGLLVPAGDRRWRVGIAIHDGAVPIGEYYRIDETYVALGLRPRPQMLRGARLRIEGGVL